MHLFEDIQQILRQAQQNASRSINKTMVDAYGLVGKRIVEVEQQGESRAAYGQSLIKNISGQLQREFGNGFSIVNLQNMRLFYLEYQIQQTPSVNLQNQEKLSYLSQKPVIPDFQLSSISIS